MYSILLEKLRLLFYKSKRKVRLKNYESLTSQTPLRLNLGCGEQHLKGWLNIDVSKSSIADIVIDFRKLKDIFKPETIDEIIMMHSISYLRLWEGQDFFRDVYFLLKSGGSIVLEFPDLAKCATHILKNENNPTDYLEGVRAIYAFDILQNEGKKMYTTYNFGWSAWHMKLELEKSGFKKVIIHKPQTHDKRDWRDTRIEAFK